MCVATVLAGTRLSIFLDIVLASLSPSIYTPGIPIIYITIEHKGCTTYAIYAGLMLYGYMRGVEVSSMVSFIPARNRDTP